MKNKFNLNYFTNVYLFGTLMFCHILTISVPLVRWQSDGYFSLILFFQACIALPLMMYVVFIVVGIDLIFQKVVISTKGIEILFFKKSIKKIDWDTILSIEKTSHNRNPALKIQLPNEEAIYLDNRKQIRQAIEFYSGMQIG